MAIKIIKIDPVPEVVERCFCKNCGATLEYVPKDVQKYSGKDYSGGPDGYTWIVCPNCNEEVVLTSW